MIKTYSSAEVAKILHCSKYTVERLARDQELLGRRVGRSWVFTEAQIEEFLTEVPENKTAPEGAVKDVNRMTWEELSRG